VLTDEQNITFSALPGKAVCWVKAHGNLFNKYQSIALANPNVTESNPGNLANLTQ